VVPSPLEDRLQAIEELWASFGPEAPPYLLSAEERVALDRRIAEDEADGPDAGIAWPELRRRLERGDDQGLATGT
jgi:putative addiction module component (TIGR02574 family)